MTTFEITYRLTGRISTTNKVWINTGDERRDGSRVNNITDAIEYFEELAENWGSYENRNAITSIRIC